MSIIKGTRVLSADSLGMGARKYAVAMYDFALDGGAQGDLTLRGDTVPAGAIVIDALLQVDEAVTGGTNATLSLGVGSAGNLQTATAVSGAPWSTTGPKRLTFKATSTPIQTGADAAVIATVSTADLTAGKFRVVVEYVELG